MFRTVPLSIIRNFSLHTPQWYMSYRFADILQAGYRFVDSLRAGSGRKSRSRSQAVSKPVWHIPLLCVLWKTPGDGQSNSLKHVEFYSKNKFEKLVHLVGFIIRIYHDARSPEGKILRVCYVFSAFKFCRDVTWLAPLNFSGMLRDRRL